MLKVNIEYMNNACAQLEAYNVNINSLLASLENTQRFLRDNTSLDDESRHLARIIDDLQEHKAKMKKLINVLDYASYEYKSCETGVTDMAQSSAAQTQTRYKFAITDFVLDFKKNYSWK